MTLSTSVDPKAAKAVGPLPAGHPPVKAGKIGVMLVNLGTPDGTDFKSMWRYLREFLSDPRVIELNRAIWYPILYGLVLTARPKKSRCQLCPDLEPGEERVAAAHLHPLPRAKSWPRRCADLPNVVVDWAMRYGNPSTASVLEGLVESRLRPHPVVPALSAILGDHHRDRQRPAFSRADEDAWQRRPSAACRLTMTSPSISKRWRRSIEQHLATLDFEPEVVSPPITASRSPISRRAIPIIATARRRRGCCANGSAGARRS